MSWNLKHIELKDVPLIVQQGRELAKQGNPLVEQLRCIYTLEDKNIIYLAPLLDYIDSPPHELTSFLLGQMVK